MADDYKPPVDLLDYLFRKWQESPASAEACHGYDLCDGKTVEQFLAHARETLRKNQPVAMDFLSATPSLRFQDALVLPIVTFPDGPPPGMEGLVGFRPVGQGTGGGLAPSRSWGVTGE